MKRSKVDRNQPEIVEAFRKCGYDVLHLHMVGGGCPDILVAKRGMTMLVEIKDGRKPPSARKLNAGQQRFHDNWPGHIYVVESVDDVLRLAKEFA